MLAVCRSEQFPYGYQDHARQQGLGRAHLPSFQTLLAVRYARLDSGA